MYKEINTLRNSENNLQCGAAKRIITPSSEMMKCLRGLMGKKFVAVADDIYVRVMALKLSDKIWLICGFDLDKAPNPQSSMDAIAEEFGISEEFITFYGIHTHTAPALGKREKEGMNNVRSLSIEVSEATDRYEEYVQGKLMEAIAEALNSMVPAQIRFGKALCGCNINRCMDFYDVDDMGRISLTISEGPNLFGPVDHNVYVLILETTEGQPISFLVNYAMHNTVMFMNKVDSEGNCAISSDVGGNVSQMIEKYYPGTVALWCSGAAGDAAPLRPTMRIFPDKDEAQYHFEFRQKRAILKQMTCNHYAAVVEAISNASEPLAISELTAEVTWTKTPGRTIIKEGRGPQQKVQIITGPDVPDYEIRVHYVILGDLIVIGIGGELYSSYALKLRECFPQYKIIVINHDASMIKDAGYIMDDATMERLDKIPPSAVDLPGSLPQFEKGYVEKALIQATQNIIDLYEGRNYVRV